MQSSPLVNKVKVIKGWLCRNILNLNIKFVLGKLFYLLGLTLSDSLEVFRSVSIDAHKFYLADKDTIYTHQKINQAKIRQNIEKKNLLPEYLNDQ